MIEKIKNLQITGKIYQSKTLLISDNVKKFCTINFIYGKNGSGKTTLSSGIKSTNDSNTDIFVDFLDEKNNIISDINNIYVFNEQFIEQNIKLQNNGINSIVLFGQQVDIQDKIDRYTEELNKYSKELKNNHELQSKLKDKSHGDSKPSLNATIKRILKNRWAAQDCYIKGNKQNSNVNNDVVIKIINNTPKHAKEYIEDKYNKLKKIYNLAKNYNDTFPNTIEQINFSESDEIKIQDLLKKEIQEPILSDREHKVLNIIKNFPITSTNITNIEYFKVEEHDICPFCYQDITGKYKEELFSTISKIYSKDSDEHKSELKNLVLPTIHIVEYLPNDIEVLDKNLYRSIIDKRKICINLIEKYREQINDKANNIYTPLTECNNNLSIYIKELNELLNNMETKRKEHNSVIEKQKQTKNELIELNNCIAYYEIKDTYAKYNSICNQINELEYKECEINNQIKKYRDEIANLKQQKASINIAKDKINHLLSYVFFNKNFLTLEAKDNQYILQSKGHSVRPSEISTGERNILALCYFFTLVNENMDENSLYKKEMLVVLDDPISSFDYNNKVGIMSLLTMAINKIIIGNENSKIILLSHDLGTIIEFAEIYKKKCLTYQLSDFMLQGLDYTKYNNYRNMLEQVYKYASCEDSGNDTTIGNTMRNVLEAFSTFMCSKGIINIMQYKVLQDKLKDKKEFFNHLMHRLVLHGESHTEDYIRTNTNDFKFNFSYTKEEKQKIARSIICFIYLVSDIHIYSMFENQNDIHSNIESWISEIETDVDYQKNMKL